ncbi:MAG: hypothetical protein JW966_04980 [Anaerolineae bacterium]|nr:hypothetical protein [Anaerolineae bacterium]
MLAQSLMVQPVRQKEAHCGPAAIEMLFSHHNLAISQETIARAAGMADSIVDAEGMRLDELRDGVRALFPDGAMVLLAKYHSTLDDIVCLLEEFRLPVGIEWQGRFRYPDNSIGERGHYSVLTGVDLARGVLTIADPEPNSLLTTSGELAIDTFIPRWWEVDSVPQPDLSGNAYVIQMERLTFVVTPAETVQSLQQVGFAPASLSLAWKYCTPLEAIP